MNINNNKLYTKIIGLIGIFTLMSCTGLTQDESPAGVLQGVYNTTQAERGATAFRNVCRTCHVPRDFRNILQQSDNAEAIISDYYELITLTMPQDSPGSLSEEMYMDVMAYLLSINGFTASE